MKGFLILPLVCSLSSCAYHYKESALTLTGGQSVPISQEVKKAAQFACSTLGNAAQILRIKSAYQWQMPDTKRFHLEICLNDGAVWKVMVDQNKDAEYKMHSSNRVAEVAGIFKPYAFATPETQ